MFNYEYSVVILSRYISNLSVYMFNYEDSKKRIENPRVGGSIPPLGTIYLKIFS